MILFNDKIEAAKKEAAAIVEAAKKEALEYLEIFYATKEGRENIKYICEKYGTEKKLITKLKLKV